MDPKNQNFQKNGKNTWRYYHFININNSHMMYSSSDIECNRQNFLPFWTVFCSFTLLTTQKMNKLPGDIIILHRCNINDNPMMYGSWNFERDGQNFLSFQTIFCLFTPLTAHKFKIWKNEKNTYRYYYFTHVYHKLQSYDVWFLRYGAWQTEFFCNFGLFFTLLSP